jgi:alkylation response protein AidB-like acyl-CoA dehydrogenase
MDFNFSAEDLAFKNEVREFLADALPDDMRTRQRHPMLMFGDTPDQRRWYAILDRRGWSVPNWPTQYGGTGWSPIRKFVFEDEFHAAHAPEFNWMGSHMVGPIIYTFGSQELKERFLPSIRNGHHIWAQGFSEPGAGSDLVSLRTNAVLDGDEYVVNGQKIWTSGAFEADWGFFLVKTDFEAKRQKSLSFVLIDLKAPGLTIRRIPQINGEAHLCEVFLDNVRVPRDQLVGEPNLGWTYAKYLLEHERATSSFIFWNKRELRRAREIAALETDSGSALIETASFRARIATLEAAVRALEWSVLRVLADEQIGVSPAVSSSILKLRGSELQQDISQLCSDLLGNRSMRFFDPEMPAPAPNEFWPDYAPGRTAIALIARAATIFGGTAQVQKNILAKLAFGF